MRGCHGLSGLQDHSTGPNASARQTVPDSRNRASQNKADPSQALRLWPAFPFGTSAGVFDG